MRDMQNSLNSFIFVMKDIKMITYQTSVRQTERNASTNNLR